VDRRGFDLTPTPDPSWAQRAKPGDVGGADAFLAFIEGTLKPAIAQRVKIDNRKQALFGHSYGGLFVLHVLLTKPDAFDTYVAASATVGYGEGQLSKEVEAARSRTYRKLPRRLLMTVGGLEASVDPQTLRFAKKYGIPPPTPVEPGKDTVTLQRNFAKSLQGIEGLETAFVEFQEETHNSSIPAYLARGARWTMLGWDQL
jgi:pimeloyl-ACP methyl ester carboxylesterase